MRVFGLLLLSCTVAYAATLRVPSRYPTIQSAMNAAGYGDTVLVDQGVYAEALSAPLWPFVLRGNVVPDTGDFPRPVIDPSSLSHSDSLRCLTAQTTSFEIECMTFRNGAAMYPRRLSGPGGIWAAARVVTLRHCLFDSTAGGLLASADSVILESCIFRNNPQDAVLERGTTSPFKLIASNCYFQSEGFCNVRGGAGSRLRNCRFGANSFGPMCELRGEDVSVIGCAFGPTPVGSASLSSVLLLWRASGEVRENIFSGIRLGYAAIRLDCACDGAHPMVIRHNTIVGNTIDTPQGTAAIYTDCDPNQPPPITGPCGAVIDSNVFEDNGGNVYLARGAWLDADAQVRANRFRRLGAASGAQAASTISLGDPRHIGAVELSRAHGNRFDSTDYAVSLRVTSGPFDARWNWWGDSTGPFNAALNPAGRGDSLTGDVRFDPWCTDSARCEEPTGFDGSPTLSPSAFRLSAYPNPFNGTTVLRLQVPQAEIVKIELFDLLGRKVGIGWSGAVAREKEITFDGSALASGVYFVRVSSSIQSQPLVSAKVVLLK